MVSRQPDIDSGLRTLVDAGLRSISGHGAAHDLDPRAARALTGAKAGSAPGAVVLETLTGFGAAGASRKMLHVFAIAGDPAIRLP